MTSKGCCRLCLAPKDECVEIWSNLGADRQKLELKIQDCVHIKVSKDDRLSPLICHACISYLNSWQSFKNRCDTAERKQLEASSEILKSKQKKHWNQSPDRFNKNLIKVEPFNVDNDNELDPSNYLIQAQKDVNGGNDRPPKGGLSEGLSNGSEYDMDYEGGDVLNQLMYAACTVCDMSFSNRANARRHERNIHGLRQNPLYPSSTQITMEDAGKDFESHNLQVESVMNSAVLSRSNVNALNDLRQRIRTKLRAHREAYDYKNPAKYRHLITPNKLSFIMRNLEFLEQAQDMKCNCCNKNYPSYKYFMGHMRKKYQHLPRNVCFKCLRQFGSKGQFIGHLKRKACINLYAIVMADDSISKSLQDKISPELKETSTNKNYNHMPQVLAGQDEFGYELFDQDGNSSSSLRNPQNCPVCDKQYNNYYNVLRHMESKHPNQLPQIYQCTRCSEGFPRQSELRDHLNSVHGETFAPVVNTQKILYSCRQCSNTYSSVDLLQEHIKEHHNNENGECNKPADPCTKPMLPEVNEEPTVADQPNVSRTLNCGLCDFALTSIEALRQHMSEIHGMDKKFFYCNICPAKFMNNRGLRFHLFRSHGIRDESIPLTNTQSTTSLLKPIQQIPKTLQTPLSSNEESGTLSLIAQLNECKICHIVYKNVEQLSLHVQLVHPSLENKEASNAQQPQLWFQCRYCVESFNSSKKLTLHMNTIHEEVVSEDYSCKDCGGVYGSKKSLWVHRYKKHPKVSDPSPCEICSRVYFDKMELNHHISLAHVDGVAEGTADAKIIANGHDFGAMHSTSDVLFSMLEMSAVNVETESLKVEETVYQCDMCPKTFFILRNLHVHRGWHFRSPDGRKVRDPNDIWQPDQMAPSKLKRKQSGTAVHKSLPTCEHCLSTFASSNNLKRHIIEVHKLKPYLNSNTSEAKECSPVKIPKENDTHVHGENLANGNDSEHQEQDYIKEEQDEDQRSLRQKARLALLSKNAATALKARKILSRQTIVGKKDSAIRSLSIRLMEEQARSAKLQKELNQEREGKRSDGTVTDTVDVEEVPKIDLTDYEAAPSSQNEWQETEVRDEEETCRAIRSRSGMTANVSAVEGGQRTRIVVEPRRATDVERNAGGLAPSLSLASIVIPECTPSAEDDEIHRQTFEKWITTFNDMMDLAGVSDERTKFLVFKVKAGPRLLEILRNTISTLDTPNATLNPLENAICRLQTYFSSSSYLMLQRRRLSAITQLPEESDRNFVLRVAETARYCGYSEGLIRDEVINVVSQRARDKDVRAFAVTLIGVENNFVLLMNKVREMLAIRINEESVSQSFKGQEPALVAPVRVDRTRQDRDRYKPYDAAHRRNTEGYRGRRAESSQQYRQPRSYTRDFGNQACWRCGNSDHTSDGCWAIRKRCNKCDEFGHIQRVCRQAYSKRRTESARTQQPIIKKVALVEKQEVVEEQEKPVSEKDII